MYKRQVHVIGHTDSIGHLAGMPEATDLILVVLDQLRVDRQLLLGREAVAMLGVMTAVCRQIQAAEKLGAFQRRHVAVGDPPGLSEGGLPVKGSGRDDLPG